MIKELLFQDLSYEQFYESIQKYIAQTLSILAKTMGRKRKHLFQYVLKYYLKNDLEWMKDDESHQRDIIP